MKYTKKMKLVELESEDRFNNNNKIHQGACTLSDGAYTKPHVLPALDRLMDEILQKTGISDADKWQLYNQTLQKYLNFVKVTSEKQHRFNSQLEDSNDYSHSSFQKHDQSFSKQGDMAFNLSGVEPIRDSLDSISAPIVRNFFENARENGAYTNDHRSSSPLASNEVLMSKPAQRISKKSGHVIEKRSKKKAQRKKSLMYQPWSPLKTRSTKAKKRQADELLASMIPCKVVIERWQPTAAR